MGDRIQNSEVSSQNQDAGDNAEVDIRLAESEDDLLVVRQLWREYWESLALPMDFQGFGDELQGLPGAYGADGGGLLLALCRDEPAGTIAMRRLGGRPAK